LDGGQISTKKEFGMWKTFFVNEEKKFDELLVQRNLNNLNLSLRIVNQKSVEMLQTAKSKCRRLEVEKKNT